jgi:hypothetical protein
MQVCHRGQEVVCHSHELCLVKAHLSGAELGQQAHHNTRGSQVGHLGLKTWRRDAAQQQEGLTQW